MHPILNVATKAAREAGKIINRASQDVGALKVQTKDYNDFVSEVDRSAEDAIISILKEAYPTHGFYGEESGKTNVDAESIWIIDPLDGTTNFLHNFPCYCVSIALQERGVLTQAVIYDPVHNDLFTATKGRGAFLNDKRIRVTNRSKLQDGLISTGFPFKDFSYLDTYLEIFKDMAKKTAGLRRPGSAALDLAYVAAGYTDGFFEINLSPWDIAAGALLVQEAGGIVGDFEGNESWLRTGNIVAGNPKVFGQMLQVIAPHLTERIKTPTLE
ncbi:inositol monophosphatase/fructose-1,6-bisphosphatase family protein [Methylophilaceae bacterium 11]|jgi:myo-inositol-1(or 4)-monophosphatase|uniref:inositol monophosphatase family protein n=1 Tax=unclassified Methylotenera TaxID=2643294 RepID=UPI00037088C5|nr:MULTISPECIES: inositol monophosphatase family protein [unclassified Methylotenera]EUJ11037.1 inositol monophosphatase/fructose-1,6-bisphosphatase family protein [Methylophilaceae bacterium 11]